jgi:Protein of unknown function (DUF1194)
MKVLSRLGAAALVFAGILAADAPARAQPGGAKRVDLELVLAVDISQSMDQDEHSLQRNGYVEAFRHKDVVNALVSGPEGRIAVTYMEWAGDFEPNVTIPWTIIDSPEAAAAFATRLQNEPVFGEQRTSISTALLKAMELIEKNDLASHRQVIDVSGDGANNAGPLVAPVRDEVVKHNITINGLPIMLGKPMEFYDIPHLDRYYKDCVIGGSAAFIAPVFELEQLAATIRKKLVLEIAGRDIEPGAAPVQFADARERSEAPAAPGVTRVQLKLPTTKYDCEAGEKVWGGNRGRYGAFPNQ